MINTKLLKEKISHEYVIEIMEELGACTFIESSDAIIFPTICHNPPNSATSMKLYYYKNSKTFYCFTECHHAYDIIELIMAVDKQQNRNRSFFDVVDYLAGKIGFQDDDPEFIEDKVYTSVREYYEKKKLQIPYEILDKNIINFFPFRPTVEWLNDGITEEMMSKFDIRYYQADNKIIIPHYDEYYNLIGIRARSLNPEDCLRGKYRPFVLEGKTYAHHLSQFCYGLWQTKQAISETKKAIIFEGEKSVLLAEQLKINNAVACCGSNISKTQILQLIKYGAKEITIAFDKEYPNSRTEESSKYFDKLYALASKYNLYCNMSFIFDFSDFIQQKQSPIDNGPEIFYELWNQRIGVRAS